MDNEVKLSGSEDKDEKGVKSEEPASDESKSETGVKPEKNFDYLTYLNLE